MFAIIPGVARLLWTQKQDIGPSPRSNFGLAYDSVRKLTYLFGGSVDSTDTWSWDGRSWTEHHSAPPVVAAFGVTAPLASREGRLVLVGGSLGRGAYRDAWEWNGSAWRRS